MFFPGIKPGIHRQLVRLSYLYTVSKRVTLRMNFYRSQLELILHGHHFPKTEKKNKSDIKRKVFDSRDSVWSGNVGKLESNW